MIPKNTELLQQLLDNMTDNIFFKDLDSRFILMNKSCAQWNGFKDPKEAVGKKDTDLFTPAFAEDARRDEQHIFDTGKPLKCKEEHAEWEDGHMKWVSTTKVPLRDTDGTIAGCIGIGRDITDLKHKEEELEAAMAELSRTNARLQQANEQIAADLQMAARLQQTFLPHNYPIFLSAGQQPLLDFHCFYEADNKLGGDYCAVHKLDDHRAALLICDAMGHGVRAALITGLIRALSENLSRLPLSAGDFLTELNAQLHPLLQDQDTMLFATACCLIIDVCTGELTGALAGHPTPYHLRPQEKRADPLPISDSALGPALAITPDSAYETFSVMLRPGDRILMYTDGICEASNGEDEEFGDGPFQQVLAAHCALPLKELFPAILEAARHHAHSTKLGDDLCLLGFALNGLVE